MGSKKCEQGRSSSGRTRKKLTIDLKKEIIEKFERGVRQVDLSREYNLHKNTVQTIIAKKDEIKQAKVAKGVSKLTARSQRKSYADDMEHHLLVWINERQMRGDPTSAELICEMAKVIYAELKKKAKEVNSDGSPGDSDEEEKDGGFKASRGWFHRFRNRTGILSRGERSSDDQIVRDMNETANDLNMEVGVEVLIKEHDEELTSKDFVALPEEEEDKFVSINEKKKSPIPSEVIEELLKKWVEVRSIVREWHPDQLEADMAGDFYSSKVIDYFRSVIEEKEKNCTFDKVCDSMLEEKASADEKFNLPTKDQLNSCMPSIKLEDSDCE